MLYLNIIICIAAILMALTASIKNLKNRFSFTINRLSGFTSLMTAIMVSSLLFQLLFPRSPFILTASRIYVATIIFINELYFHHTQIYPRWEKRSPLWLILLCALPGFAMFLASLFTDYIIQGVSVNETVTYIFGVYYPYYIAVFGFYMLGTFLTLTYKTRVLENESFRVQLFYRSAGDFIGATMIVVTFIILPYFYKIQEYHALGIPLSAFILMNMNNYAVSDERLLDFSKYYSERIFRIIIFTILLLPTVLMLQYRGSITFGDQKLPLFGYTIIIFLFFFLFFRYVTPAIRKLFRRRYLRFEKNVNEFFQGISSLADIKDQASYWDLFFSNTIDALEKRFSIKNASFYMYKSTEKSYNYSYGFGEGIGIRSISEDTGLIRCLKEFPGLLEKSMIFTDDRLKAYKQELLDFYNENRVIVALPFYSHERELIGLLLLGVLEDESPYPVDLISALDIYRIHFEASLANSLYLEEITATQIAEHDHLVVDNVKNKIIPKKLKQIDGMRISSIYLNNSTFGGDYFDSVHIRPDKLGIFLTDISDAGVDSALLALEFYTVLHTQPASYDSPERFMNILNWVITTSRFSDVYAPAFYGVYSQTSRTFWYSNAAMKPLTLFDPSREVFSELDTNGIPIGIDKSFTYEVKSQQLTPGCIGFMYSNGLETALNPNGITYSTGRIKDIIRLNREETPAVLVRKIFNDFKNFIQDTRLSNDVSLIVFRIY